MRPAPNRRLMATSGARLDRSPTKGQPAPMSARPVKHSLTLRGHRTSVSMEDAFWQAFRAAAHLRGLTLNALATEIDAGRDSDVGLASAIRVYLLHIAQAK